MAKRLFYLFLMGVLLGCFSVGWAADRGPINCGDTKIGLDITGPSYMDTWTFQGTQGARAIINAVTTSGSLDTAIFVYPPDNGPAEAQSNCLGPCTDQLDWQLQHTGLYTVVVRDKFLTNSGTYNISLLTIPGAVNSAGDPDGGIIISGETLSGTVNVASDMDAFQFWGSAGIRAIVSTVTTSGSLDTAIFVYPPDNGPAEAQSNCLGPCTDQLDWQLQHTGLYTVVVRDKFLTNSGTYNISLLQITGPVSSPGDPDGGTIASGQCLSGTINVPSDLDAFQFYGNTGDRAIVNAVTSSGSLDTAIFVYPPDNGPAEAQSNCLGPCTDQLDWQLQYTGLYTVVVRDKFLTNSGTYNICLTKIPSDLRPGVYNPSPANGASVCNLNGSFGWTPVAGATGYDVYFSDLVTVLPPVKICDNVSSPSCPFPPMQTGETYYWQAVAHTSGGDIGGPVWWFTTCSTVTYYCDNDKDGHISKTPSGTCSGVGCVPAGCQTIPGDDCDDNDKNVFPGATEGPYGNPTCSDGKDNDCNGKIDAADPNCQAPTVDLVVSSLTRPTSGPTCPTITITDSTKNQGTGTAGPSVTKFYYSTDTSYDPADRLIGSRAIPSLAPGATSTGNTVVSVPCSPGCADTYYILAIADADNAVPETNETNNVKSLSITVGADLTVTSLIGPAMAGIGSTISVTDSTKNSGTDTAGASTTKFYLSKDTLINPWDVPIGGGRAVPSLDPGTTSSGNSSVTIPLGTAPGNYYIIAVADANGDVRESSESNNTRYTTIKIGSDLIVSSLTGLTTTVKPGQVISLSEATKNQGTVTAGPSVTKFYWSTNATYDTGDTNLGQRSVDSLAPGAVSGPVSTQVTIPMTAVAGTYYIIAVADAGSAVAETLETNNTRYLTIRVSP